MLRRLAQSLLTNMTEIGLSIALVLLSFLTILLLLGWSFPQGNTLTKLMRGDRSEGLARTSSSWSLDMKDRRLAEPAIAMLTRIQRRVKDKAIDAITWNDSRTGRALRLRHSVQTFERSGATIAFQGKGKLEMGENTLIVLRGDSSLVVMDGDLRASLDPRRGGFEIVLPNGSAMLDTATGDGSFQVSVNDDQSSTVSVLKGSAEITAGGRKHSISADEAVTISPNGVAGDPVQMPDPPRMEWPERGRSVVFGEAPPRVVFQWEPEPTATGYRFEIARDSEFTDVVLRDQVTVPEFAHGNLHEGVYYWRVTGINGWVSGAPSRTGVLEMHQDLQAPVLRVDFPDATVHDKQIVLRGSAEPGSRVFIGDVGIPVDEAGEFEHILPLDPGINVVVVEAMDLAGNITYQSQRVTASY